MDMAPYGGDSDTSTYPDDSYGETTDHYAQWPMPMTSDTSVHMEYWGMEYPQPVHGKIGKVSDIKKVYPLAQKHHVFYVSHEVRNEKPPVAPQAKRGYWRRLERGRRL